MKTITARKSVLAIFLSVLMLVSMTTPAVALYRTDPGVGENVDPVANPVFPQQCSLDVILLIDNSGSFTEAELEDVKNATKGFVDDFAAKPYVSSVGVVSFEATATTEITLTDLDTGTAAVKTAIDGIPANTGEGSTNWEAALVKASDTYGTADADKPAQLVILISDGQPNVYGDDADGETFSDNGGTAVYEPVEAGTYAANVVKGEGSRVVGILIEDTSQQIDLAAARFAMENISGPIEDGPGVSAQETDWFGIDLVDLDAALASIPADVSCSIEVQKTNDANANDSFTDDLSEEIVDEGGDVPYMLVVENNGTIALNLSSYADLFEGDARAVTLYADAGLTDEVTLAELAAIELLPGDSVTFYFNDTAPDEGPFDVDGYENVIEVTAVDDIGNQVFDDDPTAFAVNDIPPELDVTKYVDANSDMGFEDVSEQATNPSDSVVYKVVIMVPSDSFEAVNLTDYEDIVDLVESEPMLYSDYALTSMVVLKGTILVPGESLTVYFGGLAPDAYDASLTDTFRVDGEDNDGSTVSDEDDATVTTPPALDICPRTPGFWKTHNGDYATGNNPDLTTDLLPVTLGNGTGKSVVVDTDDKVDAIFASELTADSHKSNGVSRLYIHLLAAKLNTANGAVAPEHVLDAIERSDELLSMYDESDWDDIKKNDRDLAEEIDGLKDTLDAFNNGMYTPDGCVGDWWLME